VIKQKPSKLTPKDFIFIILLGVMISSESITAAEIRQGALFHKKYVLKDYEAALIYFLSRKMFL